MIKIKEGNAPRSACTGGQVEAHFSGGDITKISVTGALTMPGGETSDDNGEVTIGLKTEFTLPSGCANLQVAKWNGSAWVCRNDNDTTYSAATGLDLSAGNAFSIEPDYRVKNTPDCPSGQFATGYDGDGDITCAAPSSSGVEVWHRTRAADFSGGVIVLPKGEGVDVITMPLPAGTFLMTAVAPLSDRNSDDEIQINCRLRNDAFGSLPVQVGYVDIGEGSLEATGMVTLHGVISLSSADTVRFTCESGSGDDEPDQADSATLTAIKVGTVHMP